MNAIATFERVSPGQYMADCDTWSAPLPWAELPLPRRATVGAAGYDFVCPVNCTLQPGETALIPTGMRAEIAPGGVLLLFPRSSLGFKHRMMLCNTVGVIDSDYYYAQNQGHILVKIFNGGEHPVTLACGERFCQGIFLPYGLAQEEPVSTQRSGGLGSTGK